MSTQSVLLGLALAARAVLGAPAPAAAPSPIEARAVIGHDAVVGFAQTVPNTVEGTLMLKYKPYLKVFNGCVPFPAVDADGNTSGGLEPTGDSDGDCSSSTGQVYARAGTYEEYFAIMYSWYMPKDEPSSGIGHRHDWEEAIAWLSDDTAGATLVAFSVSAHGEISTTTSPGLSGNSPLAGYISYWPLDHQLIQTTTVGGMQPLIAWDSLTTAAQNALDTTDFGDAIVPFRNDNFDSNLAKGYATI